jgi:hypothetical protein
MQTRGAQQRHISAVARPSVRMGGRHTPRCPIDATAWSAASRPRYSPRLPPTWRHCWTACVSSSTCRLQRLLRARPTTLPARLERVPRRAIPSGHLVAPHARAARLGAAALGLHSVSPPPTRRPSAGAVHQPAACAPTNSNSRATPPHGRLLHLLLLLLLLMMMMTDRGRRARRVAPSPFATAPSPPRGAAPPRRPSAAQTRTQRAADTRRGRSSAPPRA